MLPQKSSENLTRRLSRNEARVSGSAELCQQDEL